MIPARAAPGHFSVLCDGLERAEAGGEATISGVLHTLAERITRRGMVVIVSDGFEGLDKLLPALSHLRHRKHEVLFLQVVAEEEADFPYRTAVRMRDLERGDRVVRVDPAALRSSYVAAFRAHLAGLAAGLRGMNADYFRVTTATPPEQALFDYLAERSGRAGRGARGG